MLSLIIATTLATLPVPAQGAAGPQPAQERSSSPPWVAWAPSSAQPRLPKFTGDGNHPDDKREP